MILKRRSFFIAEDNLEVAIRFLESIEESILRIAEHPYIGSNRKFENTKLKEVRMWIVNDFADYAIFYEIEDKTIKILRFMNTKRDISSIFNL